MVISISLFLKWINIKINKKYFLIQCITTPPMTYPKEIASAIGKPNKTIAITASVAASAIYGKIVKKETPIPIKYLK